MCFGAHNGAEWYAPECTIPAYRIAGQQGWEWAWIAGIYFSSEGSMYVLHDGTVDRTTDGTGSVSSMTDAQIDALNITQTGEGYNLSDFDSAELKIPTFEQVVQQCVKYGMKMVIRLSTFPNGTDTVENKAKWDNFMEVINGYGVQPEDISCYLDTGTKAATCRTLIGDDVEISTHLGQSATASDFVDWFETRSITGKKAAILSYQNTNLEAVKLLHSHGIRVYSYGYNSQAQADNCALWGVDIYQNGRIYKITD
jgi:glycerophosphoryl diester phosphodiesterase